MYGYTVTGYFTKQTCATGNWVNRRSVHVCATESLTCQRSCRLCLWKQTSLIQEGSTLPTAASVTTRKMVALLLVYMALTSFAMFTPVAKMVHVSVCWCRQSHTRELRWEKMRHCTDFSTCRVFHVLCWTGGWVGGKEEE